jgi:hypothetical protein
VRCATKKSTTRANRIEQAGAKIGTLYCAPVKAGPRVRESERPCAVRLRSILIVQPLADTVDAIEHPASAADKALGLLGLIFVAPESSGIGPVRGMSALGLSASITRAAGMPLRAQLVVH